MEQKQKTKKEKEKKMMIPNINLISTFHVNELRGIHRRGSSNL
jgi:hypothetical protein